MSEGNKSTKTKMGSKQWLAVFACSMAYVALANLQYLARDYYVIYQEANGLTSVQMGMIMTAVGLCAVIASFYNGFITDLVRPKTLLVISCSICVVFGGVILTNPGYIISMVAFCVFAMLPFWTPMAKLLAGITETKEQSSKIFAWLDFFIAGAGLLAGFIASAAVASAGSAFGVKIITIVYMIMSALCVICIPFVDKSAKEESKKDKEAGDQGFNFKNVMILFRDPNQWLTWLAIGLGYTAYIGMTYISPLLASEFGVSPSVITVLDTIKNSGIGLIAPLIAGMIATRRGAVRSYFCWLGLYIASMVLIIVLPWKPAFAAIAILSVVLLSFSAKGRSAISNTVLMDVKTPMFLFGTSVGIESLIMRIPDIFMFTLAGNMIDTYGSKGYYIVFAGCLGFALAGLLCNIILTRRLKAGKDSEWFFANAQKAGKS